MWDYADTELIVYRYLVPLVCIPGILMAMASTFIFAKMRHSSLDILLIGLSAFDVLVLACSLLIYPAMNACQQQDFPLDASVCHFFWRSTLVAYPLSLIAQTGSVWACVAVTVDRFVAVTFPMQKRAWCTSSTSWTVLCAVTVFSVLFKLPSFFEIALNEDGVIVPTELRGDALYLLVYHAYGYVLMMILLPWTIIIVLNVIVTHKVRAAYGMRRNLTQQQCGLRRRDDSERRCTIMAVVMSSLFIICNVISGVNNLIEAFTDWKLFFRHRIPLSNLLVCVNSAVNMIIYCVFNRKFRRNFISVFVPFLQKKGKQQVVSTRYTEPTSFLLKTSASSIASQEERQEEEERRG